MCQQYNNITLQDYNQNIQTKKQKHNNMVVQSILKSVLSKYLDKWFYGITRDNIKAQFLKGKFVISNIGLRDSIFIGTNMPYDLRHSYVQKIQLNINWTSNQRVMTINISKIYALLSIKEGYDLDSVLLEIKKSSIKDHINKLINKSKQNQDKSKDKEKDKDGGISGFLKRLLDNVNINIKSIHLRFEDQKQKYSFGLRVQQIQIINVNEQQKPQFFSREKSQQNYINYRLLIDPLQVYLNSGEKVFLCQKQIAQITNQMILMDDYRQTDMHSTTVFSGIQNWNRINFQNVITISIKGILKRFINRTDIVNTPQFQCNVTFKSIQTNITDQQFKVMLIIINQATRYQGLLQHYVSRVEIAPRKQREGREVMGFIRKKQQQNVGRKQKVVIREMTTKFLAWAFQERFLETLKRKFAQLVIKTQITVQNLFANEKIRHIIRRVQVYRINEWIQFCMELKSKDNKKIALFELFQKDKFEKFYKRQLQKKRSLKQSREQYFAIMGQRQQLQNEVVLKLSVLINKLNIKISKPNQLGVSFMMVNTKIDIIKRRNNFKMVLAIQDLVADVFKLGYGQKYATYVPILKKSKQCFRNNRTHNLFQLQFQRSPAGKPFVFSESHINFQSIQVTLYLQVFSNLYQIFLGQAKTQIKPTPQQIKKKKATLKPQQAMQSVAGAGFQFNIIEGFIESPWIIIPLSFTNDTTKDCWVCRVGDLNIETPPYQSSVKMGNRIFYQRFLIQLKSFELKYFSSVDYYHIWLQNEHSIQTIKSIPGFQSSKHENIIDPISCSVDLSILKKHVSPMARKTRQAFSAQIRIQKVFIRVPKQLLDKLKQKVDVFGEENRGQDFIQTNIKNIKDQNSVKGLVTISNQKFKDLTLYAILKGYYIYFFLNDSENEVLFVTDVRDTTIRLTSDHHSLINEDKPKKLKLLLKQKEQHGLWKKSLSQLVSKRDRINDRTRTLEMRNQEDSFMKTRSFNMDEQQKNYKQIKSTKSKNVIQQLSQGNIKHEELQKIVTNQQTLFTLSFVMENLSIQLIDQKQKQFLFCMFKKTKFGYSNIQQKLLNFSILEWQIDEKTSTYQDNINNKNGKNHKKNIPFLSSKRLINQKQKKPEFEDEKKQALQQQQEQESNFLAVKVFYNNITGELNEVQIKVDQLYISWNVFTFNKILKFFFYNASMGDAPTAPSTQKRKLSIKFNMQKFYVYCFHDQQLIALLKVYFLTIDYSQSNIEQKYIVHCQKFQMDKYEDNDESKRVPMIMCRKKLDQISKRVKSQKSFDLSQNQSMKLQDSVNEDYMRRRQTLAQNRQSKLTTNPMYISYCVRKQQTQSFPNITKLKSQFGSDLLVSQLKCTWKNFVIYFDQEQTIRLINYFINQILGTVASKFKKRQFSQNYIFETLKYKKITTFDVNLTNFTGIITPHSRLDHQIFAKVESVSFTKNIRSDQSNYEPRIVKIPTKRSEVNIFYETMVIQVNNVNTFYKFRAYPIEKLASKAFDVMVTYSKLGFSRDYQAILNSLDDIDRVVRVSVEIYPGFQLELQKIMFLTLLQIFYQNIKHRDGKADKFEAPHPVPALKIYEIDLGNVCLNMYEYPTNEHHYRQKQMHKQFQALGKSTNVRESVLHNTTKFAQIFQQIHARNIKLVYKNQGQNSQIQMKFSQVTGIGELPVAKNDHSSGCSLVLNMNSVQGETNLKLIPDNLALTINLDKMNQIIEFTNFDSDYVNNKLMLKKKKDNFMTVNVFPQDCCVKIGDLQLFGDFYIIYTKDFKNPVDKAVIKYLFDVQKPQQLDQSYVKDIVSDKEIKVNGQNLQVYMNKKCIGQLKRLFFGRVQHASRQSMKRYRKQCVVIDGLSAMANIFELKQLYNIYETHIKKAKDYQDKILLLPFQDVPFKSKSQQKRIMQVQFQKSYVNIMRMLPQKHQKSIPPFMSYMTIQFAIKKILYATHLKQQLIKITDLDLKVMQYGGNLNNNNKIVDVFGLRLKYQENKELHSKNIQIQNAKNLRVNLWNMNQKLFALLAKQLTSISKLQVIETTRNLHRKITAQSFVDKRQSSNTFMMVNNQISNPLQGGQLTNSHQNYFLMLENLTEKVITVMINNFQFSQEYGNSKDIKLNPKQVKIFYQTGLRMLQFLDQAAKQKNLRTEIGFQLDGHGPIVLKTIKEIMYQNETQLFSSCSLKYFNLPNGIKLQIYQPFSIRNTTQKTLFFCLLDSKKRKIHPNLLKIEPNRQKDITNIDTTPYYLIILDSSTKPQITDTSKFPAQPLIKISDLPTNRNPNKIGPLNCYPSPLMQIVNWQTQTNKMNLIVFNRFRIQNNLPVSVQVNFNTVQPFKQSVIQSNNISNNNINQKSRMQVQLRIDSMHKIVHNLQPVYKYFQSSFTKYNQKPKRKQTEMQQYKIPYKQSSQNNNSNSKQLYYPIWLWCKIGSLPNNSLVGEMQIQNNYFSHFNSNNGSSSHQISTAVQNYIIYNQIAIVLNAKILVKNMDMGNKTDKIVMGWFNQSKQQKFVKNRDNDSYMVPQQAQGLFFQLQSIYYQPKPIYIQFSKRTTDKTEQIFDRYLLSKFTSKLNSQIQTLYLLQPLCLIQNNTKHVLQIKCNSQIDSNQNNKNGNNNNNAVTVFPKNKESVSLRQKLSEREFQTGDCLEIGAYCRPVNEQQGQKQGLLCVTKIGLDLKKNIKSKDNRQKQCNQQTLYWQLNPTHSPLQKSNSKYQSNIIKLVYKQIYTDSTIKHQLTFSQHQPSSSITSSSSSSSLFGYKFYNNLPAPYCLILKQQFGIIPEIVPLNNNIMKYYKDIYAEKQMQQIMKIPIQIDDQLPSVQLSHKKFSNYTQNLIYDQINENSNQITHKNSNNNRVQISRLNNLNSSRSKIVEYFVQSGKQIVLGLTNLRKFNAGKGRKFIGEIYRSDCDMEFQQSFQIRVDEPDKQTIEIVLKQDLTKNKKNIYFEGSQFPQSESIQSNKSAKKALQVVSKKLSNQGNFPKFREHKVQIMSHKKPESTMQYYIQSPALCNIYLNSLPSPTHIQPSDYKRTLQLKLFQIALTIQLTNSSKDTITLQLQNFRLHQIQHPPSSHRQHIDIKVDKLLIRADKNISILQMLHQKKQLLSVKVDIQKIGVGNRMERVQVSLQPIELNIREAILFKVLTRIAQLRDHYFQYGQKLDQSLNLQNTVIKESIMRQSQSMIDYNRGSSFPSSKTVKKSIPKIVTRFLTNRSTMYTKSLKKSNPKLLLLDQVFIYKTSLYLSFSKQAYTQNKQQFIRDPILKYFILIPAVSQLKVDIPEIEVQNFAGEGKQLGKIVINKIKTNIGSTIIRGLGSLSVLDSPVAAIDGVFQYLQAIFMINSS